MDSNALRKYEMTGTRQRSALQGAWPGCRSSGQAVWGFPVCELTVENRWPWWLQMWAYYLKGGIFTLGERRPDIYKPFGVRELQGESSSLTGHRCQVQRQGPIPPAQELAHTSSSVHEVCRVDWDIKQQIRCHLLKKCQLTFKSCLL